MFLVYCIAEGGDRPLKAPPTILLLQNMLNKSVFTAKHYLALHKIKHKQNYDMIKAIDVISCPLSNGIFSLELFKLFDLV